MPLSSPAERAHIHTRTVECKGYRRSDGLWDIEGRLVDVKSYTFHNNERGDVPPGAHGEVDINDTLESMIARSGGDTSHFYVVVNNGAAVGILEMTNLVKALVPRAPSNSGLRSRAV